MQAGVRPGGRSTSIRPAICWCVLDALPYAPEHCTQKLAGILSPRPAPATLAVVMLASSSAYLQ